MSGKGWLELVDGKVLIQYWGNFNDLRGFSKMFSHRAIYKCIYRCHRKSGVNFEMINTNCIVIYFLFNFITCLKENVCKHLQSSEWVAFNCCPSSTIHPRIHNKCNFIANYPINWAWRFPPCIRNTPPRLSFFPFSETLMNFMDN